jgi:hypothetical protein
VCAGVRACVRAKYSCMGVSLCACMHLCVFASSMHACVLRGMCVRRRACACMMHASLQCVRLYMWVCVCLGVVDIASHLKRWICATQFVSSLSESDVVHLDTATALHMSNRTL